MNLSFVDKFVHKQLDVLPSPTQEIRKQIHLQQIEQEKVL